MTYLAPNRTMVILEDSQDQAGHAWIYRDPVAIVECAEPEHFFDRLEELQQRVDSGLYAAGCFSYEVGYLFENRLTPYLPAPREFPLLWFGLFEQREKLAGPDRDRFWADQTKGRSGRIANPMPIVGEAKYRKVFSTIMNYLAAGDVYQINYTFPLHTKVSGDPLALHGRLRLAQPVPYGAFISNKTFCLSCHSPELFFKKEGSAIQTKPMKGTMRRGATAQQDDDLRQLLADDPKSKAENLMIVDLVRNDLSRIAVPNSVKVDHLFEIETYRSVIQMTTTISASLPDKTTLKDILGALYPCGSVTGAPKIRAMEIIRELEAVPRGSYTGAIGHITPQGDMCFNVPIRTLFIDHEGHASFPVGSGIVADSDVDAEYSECFLKSRFLHDRIESPSLIETMRWQSGSGYWLLRYHLDRLFESAKYFLYPCDPDAIDELLEAEADKLDPAQNWRVRLLVSPAGNLSVTATPIAIPAADDDMPTITFARQTVRSDDPLLRHKTTHRQFHDDAYEIEAVSAGHRDVLFCNEKDEVTECSRHNIFIISGDTLVTPPLASGLLPGTLRAALIDSPDSPISEKVLSRDEVLKAKHIYVGNAVSGLTEVRLVNIDPD